MPFFFKRELGWIDFLLKIRRFYIHDLILLSKQEAETALNRGQKLFFLYLIPYNQRECTSMNSVGSIHPNSVG